MIARMAVWERGAGGGTAGAALGSVGECIGARLGFELTFARGACEFNRAGCRAGVRTMARETPPSAAWSHPRAAPRTDRSA